MKQLSLFIRLTLSCGLAIILSCATMRAASATNNLHDEEDYKSAVVMPFYPGGDSALMTFINQNIHYPQAAQDNGIQGKVVVKFIVEKDGSVSDVRVAQGVHPILDQEAVRVCNMLTGFIPGLDSYGDPVREWYILPIIFKFQLDETYALNKDYEEARYNYKIVKGFDDETMSNLDDGCLLYNIANDIYPNKNYLPILRDAVNHGSNGALSTLACLYAIGKDVERDDNKAVELYIQYLDAKGILQKNISIANVYYEIYNNYSSIVEGQYDTPRNQWIQQSAELGHSGAQYELAEKCFHAKDYDNALFWLKKVADNNPDAMRMIGNCYEEGLGVTQDHKTAIQWYKKAADNGDNDSQNLVGKCYLNGDGLPRNENEAVKYFTMAANNDNQEAKYNLGLCYYNGKGTKKDYKQAAEWFGEACGVYFKPQDSLISTLRITELQIVADELVKDPPKSVDVIRKDVRAIGAIDNNQSEEELYEKATQGDDWAQYILGIKCYSNNDIKNALLWLEKAGENGNFLAHQDLVNIYCYGQKVERNYNKALYWYKKSTANEYATIGDMLCDLAKQDFNSNKNNYITLMQDACDYGSTDAMLNMAAIYAIGKDVPRNDAKAIEYYIKFMDVIKEPSTNFTISDVYYLIYCYFYDSEIIEESCDGERDQWLEKAVELGNADALCEMGNLSDNQEEAIIWYRKAAEQGQANAQCKVGNYYINKGDCVQAAQWFTKAAAQDEPEALYRLATLYSTGNGVKKDKKLANEYYQKSATGFKTSAEKSSEIE